MQTEILSFFLDLPVHFFISTLHLVDVHSDIVSDIRRRVAGVGLQVFKDDSSPEGLIV